MLPQERALVPDKSDEVLVEEEELPTRQGAQPVEVLVPVAGAECEQGPVFVLGPLDPPQVLYSTAMLPKKAASSASDELWVWVYPWTRRERTFGLHFAQYFSAPNAAWSTTASSTA